MKMDKPIVDGNLGTVGSYKIEIKNGKLRAEAGANAPIGLSAGAFIEADTDTIVDAICKAIPGHFDDVAGELLKTALKKA